MNSIKFNDFDSWEDFSLFLTEKKIEAPTPKTEEVDIPGADGVLDYTEYFGDVKFKPRKITLKFQTYGTRVRLTEITSKFQNAVHGKKMNITLYDDPDFYYVGRVKIKTPSDKKNIRTIEVECTCESYKYKRNETVIRKSVNGSMVIACENLRKIVVPQIITDGEVNLTLRNVAVSLSAGVYLVPELYLTEGVNEIIASGTATVEIRYREGGL